MDLEVNGVFEGGGAKGIAYVGALRATEDAGLVFRAVAGSSAGAITATLVACGCRSDAIEDHMRAGLASFGGPVRAAFSFHRRSLLSSRRLRAWLVSVLAERLGPPPPGIGDWTFAALTARTGVSLYVVTTDLAERQPLVFSPATTPQATVVDAVLASCAIPVAFPAQRMRIGDEVHRLADGGVWANYPAFVFTDGDFRAYHELPREEAERRTVGFVLDERPLDDRDDRRRLQNSARHEPGRPRGDDRGGARRELGVLGGLLTSPLALLTFVAAPLISLVLVERQYDAVFSDFSALTFHGDPLLLAFVAMMAVLWAFSIVGGIVLLRLARGVVDEGTVGVAAAMGVGPTVPYWVGNAPSVVGEEHRHVVVRLPVGRELGTLAFRPRAAVVDRTVGRARATTGRVLAGAGLASPLPTSMQSAVEHLANDRDTAPKARWHAWVRRLAYVLAVPLLSFVAAIVAMDGMLRREPTWRVWGRLAVVMLLTLVGLVLYGLRRHRRAVVSVPGRRARLVWPLIGLAGGGFMAFGSLLVAFVPSEQVRVTDFLESDWISGTLIADPVTTTATSRTGERKIAIQVDEESYVKLREDALPDPGGPCDSVDRCVVLSAWDDVDPSAGWMLYLPRLHGVRKGLPRLTDNAMAVTLLLSALLVTGNSALALRRWRRARRRPSLPTSPTSGPPSPAAPPWPNPTARPLVSSASGAVGASRGP